MKHEPGNGSGKFNVHTRDMGGWVRVFADASAHLPSDLPVFLSHSLAEWFRQHPRARVLTVVPISRDGNTVELHAWFDIHVFADLSGMQPFPPTPGP